MQQSHWWGGLGLKGLGNHNSRKKKEKGEKNMRENRKPYKQLLALVTSVLLTLSACNTTQSSVPQELTSLAPQDFVIQASSDDADLAATSTTASNSNYYCNSDNNLYLSSSYTGQRTALRFANVTVPKPTTTTTVTIISAKLTFTKSNNLTGSVPSGSGFVVRGLFNANNWPAPTTSCSAAGSTGQDTTSGQNINGRAATTATTSTNTAASILSGTMATWATTDAPLVLNITAVVQEIVNDSRWPGGTIAFRINKLANSTASLNAFACSPTSCDTNKVAKLTIDYTTGTPPTTNYPPSVTLNVTTPSSTLGATLPAYLQEVTDTSLTPSTPGTRYRRISGTQAEFAAAAGGTAPTPPGNPPGTPNYSELRHRYVSSQPWNSDGSLIMLDRDRVYVPILDGNTYALKKWVSTPNEPFWSNTSPNVIYGIDTTKTSFVKLTIDTTNSAPQSSWTPEFDFLNQLTPGFPRYTKIGFDGTGVLSDNGQYTALFGQVQNTDDVDVIIYDFVAKKPVKRLPLGKRLVRNSQGAIVKQCDFVCGSVHISQNSQYIVVQDNRNKEFQQTQTTSPGGTTAYYGVLNAYQVSQIGVAGYTPVRLSLARGHHMDVCVNTANEQVVVQSDVDYSLNPAYTALVSIRLSDGARTTIMPAGKMDYAIHFSCRNINNDGWVYVSGYDDSPGLLTTDDGPASNTSLAYWYKAFAVQIASGCITTNGCNTRLFAHTYHSTVDASNGVGEKRAPHAVPNRDGSRVIFASDWRNSASNAPVYAYVAYYRP